MGLSVGMIPVLSSTVAFLRLKTASLADCAVRQRLNRTSCRDPSTPTQPRPGPRSHTDTIDHRGRVAKLVGKLTAVAAGEQGPEQHAGGLGAGQQACVLMRRLNSSCRRSTAFVVRSDFPLLGRVAQEGEQPCSGFFQAADDRGAFQPPFARAKALCLTSTSLTVFA